jgi:hypothetical protein
MLSNNVLVQYRPAVAEYEATVAAGTSDTTQPTIDYRIARAYIRELIKAQPENAYDRGAQSFTSLLRWLASTPMFVSPERDALALQRVHRHDEDVQDPRSVTPPLTLAELARL